MEHLNDTRIAGYDPIYLALQGSQNYQLDYINSDVDTKTIILPSLEDLTFNKKPVSTTHLLPNDEHCDVKDIRLMFNVFRKQNINFLEILFTDYYWSAARFKPYMDELRSMAEDIAHYDVTAAVHCMCGMAFEKFNKMEHLSPATEAKIAEFGYDSKQVHHISRMREFLERYLDGEPFKDCLVSNHKNFLMNIKMSELSLEQARILAQTELDKITLLKETYMKDPRPQNVEIKEAMDKILLQIMTLHMEDELSS